MAEDETRQNTRDIAQLTTNVARLTVMIETGEKRHDEDRQNMREIFDGLKSLNEKIGGYASVQEKVTELASQMGGFRHDLRNIEAAVQGINLVKKDVTEAEKKIVEHETRINSLESRQDKQDGATGAVKIFIHVLWAVFGSGITALGFWFLSDYFQSGKGYTRTETREVISGE